MHSAIKKALMLAKNRRKYASGGVPDDASQEGFLHEQLQGSAPQYDPQGGLETAKSAAQSLAGMTTPGALADAAGYMGGPSALQNLRDQNYFDAALQLAAVVPGVGPLSKAAKLTKEAEEAANIKRYIERSSPNLNFSRRYKTTEKAKATLKPGEKLVHTMIENPPVIPPPTKRAEGGQIDESDDEETINQENPEDINTEEEAENAILHKNQRKSDNLKPIIDRGLVVKRKISVKKGQKPTTTIPKSPKYVPQAKENAEFRKLMAEVDELLEKFKD